MNLKEKMSFIKFKNKIGMILTAIIIILCSIVVLADNTLIQGLLLGANDEETLVRMAASLSKGSSLNNQIGIDSLGVLFDKYVGTGLVNLSQHSTEIIRAEFTQTGNIYDINILDGLVDLAYNEIYKITYNANGGTLGPQVQVARKNQTTTLSKIQPIREGFIFLGWSSSQSDTTAEYEAEGEYTGNEDVILYAVWEEEYQLTGTLADVTNDNIGDYIDFGNDVIGTDRKTTNDWRILYVENNKVYVILADFLPNSTEYATTAGLATNNLYNVNSNESRTDLLTKLTLNSNWIDLANGLSGATAAGTPTKDLILKSYNTANNQPESNTIFDTTTQNYNLYVSHSGEWNGCRDYWLATVNNSSNASLWSMHYSGAFGQNDYNNAYIGIRPVVCLPSNLSVTKDGDIWVVSHNTPGIIRIAFNANGGAGAPAVMTIYVGQNAQIPSTIPAKDKYVFLGWNTNKNAITAEYEAGETIPAANITGNMTLYAIWEEEKYTITYNANGGIGEPSPKTVEPGSYVTIPNTVPTKTGSTFLGWSRDQNATTATYEIGDTIPPSEITEDITLYAVWRGRYTITYNANNGTGAPEETSVLSGQDLTISTTTPTRDGHIFLGWSKNQNAITASYQPGGTMPASDITGNTTLYAIWEIVQYTITYNANQGTGAPDPTTVLWGESATIPDTVPTRTGTTWTTYTFVGWSTTTKTPSATVTADYAPGETIPASEINGDITLYATYHSQSSYSGTRYYIVLFNQQGGSDGPIALRVRQGQAGTIPTTVPTKDGYTFLGWSTTANATTATYSAGASITPRANMTLYAVWGDGDVVQYTITYNANNGQNAPAQTTVVAGQNATLSTGQPTRDGYTFLGWSTNRYATTATYQPGGTIPASQITGDITLYAVWQTAQYTITYNANNGRNAPSPTTVTAGQSATLATGRPTRTGYTFLGWSTNRYATTATYQPGGTIPASQITGDITLYAVWRSGGTTQQYTITFDACDGTFSSGDTTKTITVTQGSSATAITDTPTSNTYSTYYKFQGWATTKPSRVGQGTVVYAAGAAIPASAITGDMTLYAVYKYSMGI